MENQQNVIVIHTVAHCYFNPNYRINEHIIFEIVSVHLCEKFDNYSTCISSL